MTDGTAPVGVAIELVDVRKSYRTGSGVPVTAVDNVNLSIPAGQALAITGPSGSGKSTLLHLIGAMDTVDHGSIIIDGRDLTRLREGERAEARRHIGFVFQRFHLLPALSALDNVIAPVLPYTTPFDKTQRARELLTAVGLQDREEDLPSKLSGGQQQRVAIARALINHPALLLADEPTGNLDSRTGRDVMDLLLHLREQNGLTLLIATHDAAIAARCDRIIRLSDGRVTDDTTMSGDLTPEQALEHVRRLSN
jgi:putative ABC transport system ATP-binding protein